MTTINVINPRTGVRDYQFDPVNASDMAQRCKKLRGNQNDWNELRIDGRVKVMLAWRDEIEKYQAEIANALAVDTGRYAMSVHEVNDAVNRITYWCEVAPTLLDNAYKSGTSSLVPSAEYESHLIPYTLVGVISPWNVPLILGLIDAIPALLAGSAVIIKTSEVTPRFSEPLRQTIEKVPALNNVLEIVLGEASTGQALVSNVDLVCFTGSVSTGKKVAINAAENFIPAFLELGGKDPAIVMQDADIDAATTAILRSAAGITGQACQSLERIYVDKDIFKPFIESLSHKAKAIRLNHPDIHSGHIGPFIFPPQAQKVKEQIEDAVSHGAKIQAGGRVLDLDGGKYCEATVLTNVNHKMKVMREETFGPIMPVMPFATIEDAIALANDTEYGLSASVFAANANEAKRVAKLINAGAIGINDGSMTAGVHDVEKNAFQNSGMGHSRMGPSGLLRFFRTRSILHQTGAVMPIDLFAEENVSKS